MSITHIPCDKCGHHTTKQNSAAIRQSVDSTVASMHSIGSQDMDTPNVRNCSNSTRLSDHPTLARHRSPSNSNTCRQWSRASTSSNTRPTCANRWWDDEVRTKSWRPLTLKDRITQSE